MASTSPPSSAGAPAAVAGGEDRRTPAPATNRSFAQAAESGLQAVLGFGAALAGRARWRRGGWGPEDFRGGHCHCGPGLPLHLVHSESLREACDFVADFGSNVAGPRRPRVPVSRLAGAASRLPPGSAVHVKTDLLGDFARFVLPAIPGPIVLVTGDSDASPFPAFATLLDDHRIFHWFAQNWACGEPHRKLTRIPIGIDNPVFTKLEKRLGFAATMALGLTPFDPTLHRNDMGDQALLLGVRGTMPPTSARPLRVLCTFHENQKLIAADARDIPPRLEAWSELRENPCCHFIPRRLRQRDCWESHRDFAFEASPHGKGLDCFRTWEALALGTIPIVKRSPLDRLYRDEGFPIVVVDAWREITADNLARWRDSLASRFDGNLLEKLAHEHWAERIKTMARRSLGGP